MRRISIVPAVLLPLLAGGCIARTAWDVATLPVRATGQVVDWTTTSQAESDRNYGRKVRKQEAEEGRRRRAEDRRARREAERWEDERDD